MTTRPPMTFYLGTHEVCWVKRTSVPLFLSRVRLMKYKTIPAALGPVCVDSGGYSELDKFSTWTTPLDEFIKQTRAIIKALGRVLWCAPRDWMCEAHMLRKTGLTIRQHQQRTVADFKALMRNAPDVQWIPVLQGYRLDDYLRCWDMYEASGVNLSGRTVGVGTICRRQGTKEASVILQRLAEEGLTLHGFGFKLDGLRNCAPFLQSADSLAWSFGARRSHIQLPGHMHKTCANCMDYALKWREKTLRAVQFGETRGVQTSWL